MVDTITLTRPDDWHLHLRDGAFLTETVSRTANVFGRAIVMPNLATPVTNLERARAYHERILSKLPAGHGFAPLMTLYLTDQTTEADIAEAAASGLVKAVKLYPAGATTNSQNGVSDPSAIYPLFEALQKHGLLLLLHGEVTTSDIDIFDREKAFIDRYLADIRNEFSELRIVCEHVTTADMVDFVCAAGAMTAATVTPQHLLMNRNDLFVGGLKPHNYCLPVLKRRKHQERIREVVASGHKQFFLGTDSAPHARHKKEAACGCAGCYSAPAALPLYARFFEDMQALDQLEAFASHNGPDFYQLPRNTDTITLVRQPWTVPASIRLNNGEDLIPFAAGDTLDWQLIDA